MRIVVTGAARGLGAALSTRFQQARHVVMGVDRDWPDPPRDPDDHGDLRYQTDLADPDAVTALAGCLAQSGAVDVVVHNAGINATGPFQHLDIAAMRQIVAINLRAPILLTAALLERDLISEGGMIVLVGSLSSYLSYPGAAVYAASKDGVLSFSKSLSVDLARRRIGCLCVLPGPLRTEHGRRHAPPGSPENGRLDPALAAQEIYDAIRRQRRTLVPGWRARLYRGLGSLSPGLAESAMRKLIYLPLLHASR